MGGRVLSVIAFLVVMSGCVPEPNKPIDKNVPSTSMMKNKGQIDTTQVILPHKEGARNWHIPRQADASTIKYNNGNNNGMSSLSSEDEPLFQKASLHSEPGYILPMPDFTDIGIGALIECARISEGLSIITTTVIPALNAFFTQTNSSGSCELGPYNGVLMLPDPSYCLASPREWHLTDNQKIIWKQTSYTIRAKFTEALGEYQNQATSDPSLQFAIVGLQYGSMSCNPYVSVLWFVMTNPSGARVFKVILLQ